MIDEELYQLASDELNSDKRRADIWARACALASDDHDEARYLYTNLRVEQLLAEREDPALAADTRDDASSENPGAETLDDDTALTMPGFDEPIEPMPHEVTAGVITTHDLQSNDLSPDDFSAPTLDIGALDAEQHSEPGTVDKSPGDEADGTAIDRTGDQLTSASLSSASMTVADDTVSDKPTDSTDDTATSEGNASTGSPAVSGGSAYWDDEDYSFDLEPLENPSESGTDIASSRSGVDGDNTTRLSAEDLDQFSSDSALPEERATGDNAGPEIGQRDDGSPDTEAVEAPEAHQSGLDAGDDAIEIPAHDARGSLSTDLDLDNTLQIDTVSVARYDADAREDDAGDMTPADHAASALASDPHTEDREPAQEPISIDADIIAARQRRAEADAERGHGAPLPEDQAGRSWLIFRRQDGALRAVKQGVCWPAMFATLPWLLSRALFGTAVVYSALWVVLLTGLLVSGLAWLDAGEQASLLTRLLFAAFALMAVIGLLYLPFRHANLWHAQKLENRGYSLMRQLNARNAQAAVEQVRPFLQQR